MFAPGRRTVSAAAGAALLGQVFGFAVWAPSPRRPGAAPSAAPRGIAVCQGYVAVQTPGRRAGGPGQNPTIVCR